MTTHERRMPCTSWVPKMQPQQRGSTALHLYFFIQTRTRPTQWGQGDSKCWVRQKICLTSPLIGLPHLMRHMVLHKWTWKTGVLSTELPSFPLQVQFLGGKVFLRVMIFATKLPITTCV